ncbi:MAG TPA: CYTH and CHAD domain-containing protein, partial [Actinomycetota bacterium]
PLFRLPDLSDLADGVRPLDEGAQRFVTSYHDTDDLRLARWGASLRYRTGEGWTVKLPQAVGQLHDLGVIVRQEHTFESGPGKPPAEALDLVRAFVRSEPVSLSVRLQTVRRRTELIGADDSAVAEVVDDEVSVLDGRRVVGRFRELEVELAPGSDDGILRSALGRLRKEGAEPSTPLPKHVRALQPRSTLPPDVQPIPIGRDATVTQMVRAALSESASRLIRSDPVVRLDQDPEGVHQARVATRRLRSDLRTFRALLDPEWDAGLRGELRWLTEELGPVRDLDVLEQRLRSQVATLPEGDSTSAPKLLERLRVQREEARAELLSAMREDRYVALLDRVVAAASEPMVLSGVADRVARDLLGDLMAGPWNHLQKSCEALGPASVDGELHEARIRAKRARYASEALLPVAPKRARRFAKRAAALQDVLGQHQDAVVAAAWLREQALGTTARVAFTAGELASVEARSQRTARKQWPKAWAALADPKVRFW